ncbi:selenium cofactor biosynthesis protein YqeC [Paludibacterium sp. B53371]|uniref:selenium cofactor biosynthesis protein YqeC n=1 Tax=Paludibacterium sp. B53371 TaxID=2806263 RepID=UPI001C0431BD|nr:selenium cofactor biosynthesis protein YqeC [Paludibacterium sp. B53371]
MYHFENAIHVQSCPDEASWLACLGPLTPGDCRLISLCGAGGKTSTLFWLARVLQQRGLNVLLSTTTRMYLPTADQVTRLHFGPCPPVPAGGTQAWFAGHDASSGKVIGLAPAQLDELRLQRRFDVILVEADGAHQKLFKVPAQHEPCIPAGSDVVISLLGSALLGTALTPDRVHRWDALQSLTGIVHGQPLDWALLDGLLSHPQGLFKGCPDKARRIWFVHGEHQHESAWLADLARLLSRHPALTAIWQGAVRETPAIRHLLLPTPAPQSRTS